MKLGNAVGEGRAKCLWLVVGEKARKRKPVPQIAARLTRNNQGEGSRRGGGYLEKELCYLFLL